MPNERIKSADMYGITRGQSQNGKHFSWKIYINRRGLCLTKSFTDLKWGGSEKALAAAKQHRDALIQLVPPLSMREYAQNLRATNNTGFAGVLCSQKRHGIVWTARIQLPSGKAVTKSFSESVHGLRARELAIQARLEMLNLLDEESKFTFSPGALAKTSAAGFLTPPAPPRTLTVRVQRRGVNSKIPSKNIYVRVSDAVSPPVLRTFSTGAHGETGAFRLTMQTALKAITQLCGEEISQVFARDYVQKYKRLPKKGVSARIPFTLGGHSS